MNRITQITTASIACALVLALFMAGCDSSEDTLATYDVSGSWLYSDTEGNASTWALVQSNDGTVTGAGTAGETISGLVSDDSINMSLMYSSTNAMLSLAGTVLSASTMSGTLTTSESGSGSWTAVKTN